MSTWRLFRRAVRPDRKHLEALAEAQYRAKLAGADEAVAPMSVGRPWLWGVSQLDRRFQEGDMVATEFTPTLRDYYGQVCRSWVIGKASVEQRGIYDTVLEASERMAWLVKPGVSGEELWQAGMKVIGRAGYEFGGIRFGHGMGLAMAEGLDLMPNERSVLQAGYYVMVHPHVFQPKTGNAAIIGDAFLVTETGCQKLTKAKKRLKSQ
ncbi:M24 family metallopeptidase [Chloroflexota bacterium]